jgi:Transglycosylase SLT domain
MLEVFGFGNLRSRRATCFVRGSMISDLRCGADAANDHNRDVYRNASEGVIVRHFIHRSLLGHRTLIAIAADITLALTEPFVWADCFDDAAAYQRVNPIILRAITWQESHNRADATHLNANGSLDYGVMQINSVHLCELARYHIDRDTLMETCKNVYIAAWHLHGKMDNTAILGSVRGISLRDAE